MRSDVDNLVRTRLRALRNHHGWSLDDLAKRTGVGASTISRIETGNRSISLDMLVPLARELGIQVDELLTSDTNEDVVIQPSAEVRHGMTVWPLSRPGSPTSAFKIKFEPNEEPANPKVHPGYDWLFVVEGVVELTLGKRRITVKAGESAEFSTMTPHAVAAIGEPAEVIMLFSQDSAQLHFNHT